MSDQENNQSVEEVLDSIKKLIHDSEYVESKYEEKESTIIKNNDKAVLKENLISEELHRKTKANIASILNSKNSSEISQIISKDDLHSIVEKAIKPYLKNWLDKNLPDIIQRMLEKEITKLISK